MSQDGQMTGRDGFPFAIRIYGGLVVAIGGVEPAAEVGRWKVGRSVTSNLWNTAKNQALSELPTR